MTWPPIGNFQLNDGALKVLQSGNPYETLVSVGNNHEGNNDEQQQQQQHLNMVVQDFQAPPSIIWEHIVDYFDSYSTDELHDKNAREIIGETHHQQQQQPTSTTASSNNGSQTMFTRLRLKSNMNADSLSDSTLFLQHSYNPTLGSLTSWSVIDIDAQEEASNSNAATAMHDPSSYSYCGYWYVVTVPHTTTTTTTTPLTRVHHSVQVGIAAGNENNNSNDLKRRNNGQEQNTDEDEQQQQQMAAAHYLSSHKALIETMEWVKTRSEEKHVNNKNMEQETLVDDNVDDASDSEYDIQVHDNDETCDSTPSEGSQPTNDATTTAPPADIEIPKQVGLTRYAMLASIVVLSLYNVHLYFSQ